MSLPQDYGYYFKQKTNTSKRTKLAFDQFNFFRKAYGICENKSKLEKLKRIDFEETFAMDRNVLKLSKHYFVYDPLNKIPTNYFDDIDTNANIVSVSKLKLIDEPDGCYYTANNEVPAFILVPRKFALEANGKRVLLKQYLLVYC